jgi:hypothetical protein
MKSNEIRIGRRAGPAPFRRITVYEGKLRFAPRTVLLDVLLSKYSRRFSWRQNRTKTSTKCRNFLSEIPCQYHCSSITMSVEFQSCK